MTQAAHLLRKLGCFERFCAARYQLGYGPVVVVGIQLEKDIFQDAQSDLEKVARLLYASERPMSVVVFDEDDKYPHFGGLGPEFDPSKNVVIENNNDNDPNLSQNERVNNFILNQINQSFDLSDKSKPLWRLVLNKNGNPDQPDLLSIVLCHLIADGSSSRRLLERTINYLDIVLKMPPKEWPPLDMPTEQDVSPASPMPPCLEDAYDTRPGMVKLLSAVYRQLIRPWIPDFVPYWLVGPPLQEFWTGNKKLTPSSVLAAKPIGRFFVLSGSLSSVAKSANVTIQSLVHTLLLSAVMSTNIHFKVQSSDACINFVTETPAALDPPPKVTVGNYVSDVGSYISNVNAKSKFWELAQSYHKNLHDPSARKEAIQHMGLLAYIPNDDIIGFFKSKFQDVKSTDADFCSPDGVVKMPYGASFEVSNLGIINRTDMNKNNDHIVLNNSSKTVFFGQPVPAHGFPFVVDVMSLDKTSDISLHLTSREGVLDDDWLNQYIKYVQLGAQNLLKQDGYSNSKDINIQSLMDLS